MTKLKAYSIDMFILSCFFTGQKTGNSASSFFTIEYWKGDIVRFQSCFNKYSIDFGRKKTHTSSGYMSGTLAMRLSSENRGFDLPFQNNKITNDKNG
ncbi:MAG: hypothetical protein ACM3H8_13690 [Sphingobacteriales bacterium]